ncbi:ABC transporter permease [Sphaerisporangium dianthi]|uniref:ABC transporter permease n=1 Tax=Sphaerisporangium dianthi TaxID=1436120 RepID=A0ABV9CIN4_9ACTN
MLIAGVALRRLARDRSNLFFMLIFPLALILVLGMAFGGASTPRLGLLDQDGGPLAARVVNALRHTPGVAVVAADDEGDLRTAVERGGLQAGLVIPAGYGAAVGSGGQAALRYLARPDRLAQQLGVTVQAVVTREAGTLRAARFAAAHGTGSFGEALTAADAFGPLVPAVRVTVRTTGTALFPATLSTYDVGAASQLLLFVFLTSLTGAVALIETRRLGVSRRMTATPTPVRTIMLGEAAGRIAVALLQGLIIMVGSALLFGVNWGDPLGAGALLAAFALVGSGAAMLVGAVLRSEQQAGGLGVLIGLGLGALGGSMVPIELFSDTMRAVAHLTPHAWAADGFAELVRRGGGIGDILPELGMLLAYAAALFLAGAWRFGKALTS